MRDDFAGCPDAAGFNHLVAPDPEDRPFVNYCAAEDLRLLRASGPYGFLHIFVLIQFVEAHDTGKREFRHLQAGAWSCLLAAWCAPILGFSIVSRNRGGSGSTRPCIELEKMPINTIIVDDEKP